MKVVALISGGKDSCYNMIQCVAAGHTIVALANLRPANTDEMDSYMYQTVGHQAIDLYAEAMGLPLYRRTIEGCSLNIEREYSQKDGDEVEDLYQLLKLVKIFKNEAEDKGRLKGQRASQHGCFPVLPGPTGWEHGGGGKQTQKKRSIEN